MSNVPIETGLHFSPRANLSRPHVRARQLLPQGQDDDIDVLYTQIRLCFSYKRLVGRRRMTGVRRWLREQTC